MADRLAHDESYKLLFGQPAMVAALLSGIIQGDWLGTLDLSTLTPLPGEHISGKLDRRHCDLVWKVRRTDGCELYLLILLEHQSSNDTAMALRMYTYRGLLYESLLRSRQIDLKQGLPNLLPVVLYSGTDTWTARTDVADLLQPAPAGFRPWQPGHRYLLIDEGSLADDPGLPQDNLATLLFRLEHNKGIDDAQQLLQRIYERTGNQRELRRAFVAWARYVLLPRALPDVTLPAINDILEVRDMLAQNSRSWTEQWKQQGLQEGRQQGHREGHQQGERELLRRLFVHRFGEPGAGVDERLRGATAAELERWAENLLDARTPEEVFEAH